MADKTKEEIQAEMDAAAKVAEQEFLSFDKKEQDKFAKFWQKHFAGAGHKRLGRMLVKIAKTLEPTPAK